MEAAIAVAVERYGIDPETFDDAAFRRIVEQDAASLAARNASEKHLGAEGADDDRSGDDRSRGAG